MEIKDWIYALLAVSQIGMLIRVRMEGAACGWTRQARWICRRMTAVTVAVWVLTLISWQYLYSGDVLLDGVLATGLIAMTLIIGFNLPTILDAMVDERVGEELNIRMNEDNDNL